LLTLPNHPLLYSTTRGTTPRLQMSAPVLFLMMPDRIDTCLR
jgi:hypothetical protein